MKYFYWGSKNYTTLQSWADVNWSRIPELVREQPDLLTPEINRVELIASIRRCSDS